ncbi:MAG: phospho-N-acetylmuramoyl-pentapeptide-transferase [Candidatus Gastranaerophilaceae bacterium]|nr:phospho-N-acetylmuramoyl-pentapeptide-transferase [Candidatus Gastranaerophilaceae bacterium]
MIMMAVAFLLAMILCLLFGVPYIDFLRKKTIGQYVKDCAPETHAKKEGTPTTGGVFIILAIIIASVITLFLDERFTNASIIILITLLFYTFAGFQDDYLKIKGHANDGLSARGKLLRQVAIALLPTLFVIISNPFGTTFFAGHYSINLKWLYPLLSVFVITGASNAYNLTDGLDGLAASTGVFAFLGTAVIAFLSGYSEIAIIAATVAGALFGFLYFNKPKAQVFMGDTGSLAIGGLLGTLAVMGKFEFLLIFLGGVFVCETLSVIIQVTSFKTTGKRVFKMSPIHHHFELLGWSEKKVVTVFALCSAVFSAVALILFYLTIRGII